MKIFNIKHIPEDLLPIVGGKARGLNQLNKFGFNVPEGFVVMDLETDKDYEEAAEYYLKSGLGKVAVRSSATLEDGKDFSSAGQFSTFLNIEGKEAFIKALRDCIESLNSVTAQTYSKMFLKGNESKMTIVVQQMVTASLAGVLFTKNPQDRESVLIEVVKGLGESLVSGQVSAEQYVVKNDLFERGTNVLLNDYQVKSITNGAKIAETNFKMPMDLEWAINEKGELNWLQARPITVNDDITVNELDYEGDNSKSVMTTCNIREVMPGAVTPLTLSTTMYALDYGMRKIMEKDGCVKHVDDLPAYSCLSNYYGQMFFNLSTLYIIFHTSYLATKSALELSICGRPLNDFPDIEMKNPNFFKKCINTTKFLKYAMDCKGALKGMDKTVEKIKVAFDLTQDAAGIFKQCDDNFQLLNDAMFYHYWTSWYSGSQCNSLITIEEKNFENRDELQAKMAGALTNIENIESAQIIKGMRELKTVLVKNNPDIIRLNSDELATYLANLQGEEKAALDAFMERHGHRGIRENEMRSKAWRDDIHSFATSLCSVLQGSDEVISLEKTWEEYAKEILYKENKVGKKILGNFIVKARKGVYYREYTKSRAMLVAYYYKKAYQKIAELLVNDKILPDADLIYFLRHKEIGELINGDSSLMKKAIARRRLFKDQSSLRFPEVFIGKPVPLKAATTDESINEYRGTPVSRGIVEGKARVVRSVEDANKLEANEIMIAEFTDIGWSPYYCKIAGLVTEIGSSLSHGVVVAREYSLPTVVNVIGALDNIKDGDYIRVDGNSGVVAIIKRNK